MASGAATFAIAFCVPLLILVGKDSLLKQLKTSGSLGPIVAVLGIGFAIYQYAATLRGVRGGGDGAGGAKKAKKKTASAPTPKAAPKSPTSRAQGQFYAHTKTDADAIVCEAPRRIDPSAAAAPAPSGPTKLAAPAPAPAGTAKAEQAPNAVATSGYYHFASTGQKTKSKWDEFDVDEELRKVDDDDGGSGGGGGGGGASSAARRRAQAKKKAANADPHATAPVDVD